MKLQTLKTFIVGNPPPGFGGRYFVFVKLATDDGIEGLGEVYGASFGPKVIKAMIEDVFERYLLNQDPHKIERFFRRAHGSGFSFRPDSTMMGIVSALEMACWDIIGKAANKPIYELLGGRVHERLRTYTYLYPKAGQNPASFYNDPEASAARAAECVAMGFTAVKFDPAGAYSVFDAREPDLEAIERSVTFCKKIREAVGMKADLLFGTHGQFTASGAIRIAKRLEPFNPLWFEEPTPPDMPEEMAKVARATSIPIAAGERLCTKWEFQRVLQNNAASILQMNLGRVGGILEAKKIVGMAEAHYATIAPHLYCGPVVGAANIQLATCSPNFLILEGIEKWDGFHAKILKKPLRWEEGYIVPPTAPGLGIELDEKVAAAHPYEGNRLHLEMSEEPYEAIRHIKFGGG